MRSVRYLAVLPLALLVGVGAPENDRVNSCQSLNAASLEATAASGQGRIARTAPTL